MSTNTPKPPKQPSFPKATGLTFETLHDRILMLEELREQCYVDFGAIADELNELIDIKNSVKVIENNPEMRDSILQKLTKKI